MVTVAMMVVAIAEPKPVAVAITKGAKVIKVVKVVSRAIVVIKVVLIATVFILVRVVVTLVCLRVLGVQGFPATLWCEPDSHPVKGQTGFYAYLCYSFPCQMPNLPGAESATAVLVDGRFDNVTSGHKIGLSCHSKKDHLVECGG